MEITPDITEDGFELHLDAKSIKSYYRRFLMIGFTPSESMNLVAISFGLHPAKRSWTMHEILALEFIRDLHTHLER